MLKEKVTDFNNRIFATVKFLVVNINNQIA